MRVVYLCREQPWRDHSGGLMRNYQLITGLAGAHRVTLVTFSHPAVQRNSRYDELDGICEDIIEVPQATCAFSHTSRYEDWTGAVERLGTLLSSREPRQIRRWRSPEFVDTLRRLRTGGDAVVVAARPAMAEMAREAGFTRILLDLPDLESELVDRSLSARPSYKSKPIDLAEAAKLRRYDARLPSRFWRIAVVKEEDRRYFARVPPEKIILIPNGTEPYCPTPQTDEVPGEILFVGGLYYHPNIDAVLFFHREIFPIIRRQVPEARFRIVGLAPDESIVRLDNGQDCIVNPSVEDLAPYYARASVVVTPIRLGAGSKLKVVEALSRGKALVSTTFGAQGFDLRAGVDLEIADSADEFAAHCARLLRDPAARAELASSGRARTLERYTWGAITRLALTALQGS